MRVAIVGGGIGGVAAANALLQAGLDVDVYEQAPALTEVGAGIALQPNGVRMLGRLGFGADVGRWGALWTDPQYRHSDGRLLAPLWPPGMQVEFYGMHRADLLEFLVRSLPAGSIHTNHRCVGFSQDASSAILSFANGARVTADVVVAADGIHSTLQGFVTLPSRPVSSGMVAYRGLVPAACVDWPSGAMRTWVGPGKHFMTYPVRAGELLNYVGFVPMAGETAESWSAPGDRQQLVREFAGWDPVVESVLANVDKTFWWGLYDREPLPRWTNGRLTLLGDAAHPMLPHVGQGANQAIEDGVCLATLLRAAPAALVALRLYEQVRRDHTARVQLTARRNGARYDSATDDLQERDRTLQNQAQERAWIWTYDAQKAAEAALREMQANPV